MAQQIVIEVPGTKISELEPTSSVSPNDVMPIVQGEETKKAPLEQVANLVKAGLGSAALKNESDFATPTSVSEVNEASLNRDDAQNERIDAVEYGLVAIGNGADKSFSTYAEMIAYVPPQANVSVRNNDPDPALRGTYTWTGTEYVDGYDPLDTALAYVDSFTDQKLVVNLIASYDPILRYRGNVGIRFSDPGTFETNDCYLVADGGVHLGIEVQRGQLLIRNASGWRIGDFSEILQRELSALGGLAALIKSSDYLINGYINNAGVFVSNTVGYKLSYFKPVKPGQVIKFATTAGNTVSVLAFFDANRNYISSVVGVAGTAERTVVVPANAVYVRSSNNSGGLATPYVKVVVDDVLKIGNAVTETDIEVEQSANLAKPEYIVNNKYINNAGTVSSSVDDWRYIKVPVEPGFEYTIGRIVPTDTTYYSFFDSVGNPISNQFGSFSPSALPKTFTAPTGAAFLGVNIKRPANSVEVYAQLTINVGNSLIEYVDPADTVVGIGGRKLKSSAIDASDLVKQNGSATLSNVLADSLTIGTLILNLEAGTTQPAGLALNEAWLDTTDPANAYVRVKLL